MKKLILIIAALAMIFTAGAQKEANNWYFGDYAGLNFGLGLPIAVNNGQLTTWEGCSSISTSTGELLFYTDGTLVWNKDHLLMANGQDLMGHRSSTQSGIIVPKPGNANHYYIFTVDARDNNLANGLRYSLVDMTLNNGLGDVVGSEKNVPLIAPTCEKVTAVGNADGSATWVLTHHWGTNAFYAYSVSAAGVNTTPVISNVGDVILGDMEYSKGYLKASPDGGMIAIANNTMYSMELFNFNNSNGVLTHFLKDPNLPGGQGGPYGVEFSPNSELLYISQWKNGSKLYQYNLEAGSVQDILDSKLIIATVGQNDDPLGALQLGPDNRIYCAKWGNPYLAVIGSPNTYGFDCGFVSDATFLGGRESAYGLPPFIQSFFFLNAEFYYDPPCYGDYTQFYSLLSDNPDSVVWDFGDPASGSSNSSNAINPMHLFTNSGLYLVTLQAFIGGQSASAFHLLIINNKPLADAGPDQSIPFASSTQLQGSASQGTGKYMYEWEPANLLDDSSSATPNTVVMQVTTMFILTVTDSSGACYTSDEMFLQVTGSPLGVNPTASPTGICLGEMSELMANPSGGAEVYTYAWTSDPPGFNTDIPNPHVFPTETTTYFISINDGYNTVNGQVTVEVMPSPVPDAGNDKSVIYGTNTTLNGSASNGSGDYSYSWEPSELLVYAQAPSPTTVKLYETAVFTLNVIDNTTGCENLMADNVVITIEGGPLNVTAHTDDTLICDGGTTQLHAYGGGGDTTGQYLYTWSSIPPTQGWPTNEQNPVVTPEFTTHYTVHVDDGFNTASNTCMVVVSGGPNANLGDDIDACPYDTVTLTANIPNMNYYWSNGSIERSIKVGTTGIGFDIKEVWLEIRDDEGCMGYDEVTVNFDFAYCFGIGEHGESSPVDIFPNPSSGIFSLSLADQEGSLQVSVIDVHGVEVLSFEDYIRKGDIYEKQLDLRNIPHGVYFIKIVNQDEVSLGKIILN